MTSSNGWTVNGVSSFVTITSGGNFRVSRTGVYQVLLPRKIAVYTYHLNGTSTITDAPTIRSLKFALQDEFEDWRDGEMMLQSLIDTPEKVERANRRQAHLERLYLESGGIAGPGSLGEPVEEVAP